jgi:uncharacterized protein (UPF0335 family)
MIRIDDPTGSTNTDLRFLSSTHSRITVRDEKIVTPLSAFSLIKYKKKRTQSPFSLSHIRHLSEVENAVFSEAFDILHQCLDFLDESENIPFSITNFRPFKSQLHSFIDRLETISRLEPKLNEKLKHVFRGELYPFISKSKIARRALQKPFGYPGDYQMLQHLYDDQILSEDNVGKFFDFLSLQDPLCRAVINRVSVMANQIQDFIDQSEKKTVHILNIASGSGFDIKTIVSKKQEKSVYLHCFDQDVSSLKYVGERYIGVNPNVHLLLYKEDIKRFFKDWNGQKFDLIYNIGLADYLPDRVLKSFMQEAINALNDNGKFVLAHKDYLKFPHVYTSWIYDWNFIHRSLSDYNEFIQNHLTGFDQYNVFFESANQIIYFGEFSSRS